MKRTALAIVLMFAVVGLTAAQEHPEHPAKETTKSKVNETAASGPVEAVLVGENICLGCTLKKSSGAAAQCDVYGHSHVLKVTSATVGGEDAPAMQGWILHYLENDISEPYIKEHHGETVKLTGKVYAHERVFEVVKQKKSGTK